MTEPLPKDDVQTHAAKALEALLTRITDTLAGFDKIVEEAEESFLPLAQKFRRLHAAHADRLSRMMADAGVNIDEPASFMATVNETVITVRANITGIDHNILSQVRSGEQHVLDAFDEAAKAAQSSEVLSALAEMRAELEALVNSTKQAY